MIRMFYPTHSFDKLQLHETGLRQHKTALKVLNCATDYRTFFDKKNCMRPLFLLATVPPLFYKRLFHFERSKL